jgi:hypothetical protein
VTALPRRADLVAGTQDLRALLRFRRDALSPQVRRRLRIALAAIAVVTVALVEYAAWLPGLERVHAGRALALLPSAMIGFVVLTVLGAVATGGGREVVPRDELVAYPVSSVTQHLGALLMAPLNIAWLLEAWLLLVALAYGFADPGPALAAALVPVLLWIAFATALGQLVGWLAEGVRRGRGGIVTLRLIAGALGAAVAVLIATDRLAPLLDRSPTRSVLLSAIAADYRWGRWAAGVAVLVALTVLVTYAGCLAAGWALGRPEREELRLESGRRRPRPQRSSAVSAMMRIDRAAVWRSVPLRRGLAVLAVMPGAVALAGDLDWSAVTVLPGLVVSGGALLYGVNAWSLDGRGALWRDSLPASAQIAFWSRALVLAEVLVLAAATTSVLAVLRAGRPTEAELATLACTLVVTTLQVVGASLRWSVRRPFASDLRSARATPAPPVVMVGYSARLALTTTVTGLVFRTLATQPDWRVPVAFAVPMVCWSAYRLVRAADAWTVPEVRADVVRTVAA